MHGLSFSEEFFTGTGDVDIYDVAPSDQPTSVYQAIISLPRETQLEIAREVMDAKEDSAEFYVDSESFAFDVLEKVRETDLCDDLCSPITVYIDPDQSYSVTVYEED